ERAARVRAARRAVHLVRNGDRAGGARRAQHPLLPALSEVTMLSLRELERAAAILRREIVGHRIQQVGPTDETPLALQVYGGGEGAGRRRWITASCDAERARVGELREAPGGSGAPAPRFAQYLRAHLRGARVQSVELLDGERQLALRARGEEGELTLLLAIF